jgi:hypothetical protein
MGEYPEMEDKLAEWIRTTRNVAIVVDTDMVREEGRRVLSEQNPYANFKFSNGWLDGFFSRNGFAVRRVTNSNAKRSKKDVVHEVMEFHLDTRALQSSESNDVKYGYAPPYAVFNRDQVPIALASSYARTVDDVGREVILDSSKSDSDEKRFCTLDLHIPMQVLPDRSNVRKPHLIFRATAFCKGEDWDGSDKKGEPKERDLWDKRMTVSLQSNAWLDSQTNIYGISQMTDLNATMEELCLKAVQFEDNLSSHKTEEVIEAWRTFIPSFKQCLFKPNLTWCLQPIDRHLGKQYQVLLTCVTRSSSLVFFPVVSVLFALWSSLTRRCVCVCKLIWRLSDRCLPGHSQRDAQAAARM